MELISESFYRGLLWVIYDGSGLMWFYVLQFEARDRHYRDTKVHNTCQTNCLYVCFMCAGLTPLVLL